MDSHHDLPRDERSREDIEKADLQPFRMAIAEEIEMLMTAHVLYPALDPDFPATLSPRIVTGMLREQLGFRGVVATDDLEMGAIVRHGGVERAVVQALKAGADMLLICHQLELALCAREACLVALDSGELTLSRIEESAQRIALLKRQHARQSRASRGVIGAAEHRQLAEVVS
jgi:beta-N-acetylhexosaminidase